MQALRHYYLQTMGIQVWQSREMLPGAKPESLVSHSEETIDVDAKVVSIDSIEMKAAVTQGLPNTLVSPVKPDAADVVLRTSLVNPVALAQTEKALQTPDIVSEKSAQTIQTPNPEFRIASIVFPSVCVVVTQVPVRAGTPIVSEHLALLKELLLAIKVPVVDEPEVTLFNWPMLRRADFDQSAEAACDACQAFLRGQKSRHEVNFVLLMGEIAGQYLLPDKKAFVERKGRLYESTETFLLLTNSVEEVFSEAQLKAQLWHDLQPLVAWLEG